MKTGSEIIKTFRVTGTEVDIVGCYDSDTPEGKYDFYDLFIGSQCINEGEPLYKKPTIKVVKTFVRNWKRA